MHMSETVIIVIIYAAESPMAKTAKTAAQKQREYRMRRDADPVRREAYLERERKAWDTKKELKQWKPMAELNLEINVVVDGTIGRQKGVPGSSTHACSR